MTFKLVWDKDTKRFWKNVDKTESCWLWKRPAMHSGYGYFWNRGRHGTAHQFSWNLHYGAIPVGKFVCHKCDVRPCVRPDHLFVATHKENVLDMISKDRRFTKISIADARAIRALHLTGRFSGKEIGNLFEIGKDYANQVIRGESRKEYAEAVRIMKNKKGD